LNKNILEDKSIAQFEDFVYKQFPAFVPEEDETYKDMIDSHCPGNGEFQFGLYYWPDSESKIVKVLEPFRLFTSLLKDPEYFKSAVPFWSAVLELMKKPATFNKKRIPRLKKKRISENVNPPLKKENLYRALRYLESKIAETPTNEVSLYLYINECISHGEEDRLITYLFERCMDEKDEMIIELFSLCIYRAQEDFRKANDCIKTLLDYEFLSRDLRYYLFMLRADWKIRQNNLRGALLDLNSAIKTGLDFSGFYLELPAYTTRARINLRLKRYDLAIKDFRYTAERYTHLMQAQARLFIMYAYMLKGNFSKLCLEMKQLLLGLPELVDIKTLFDATVRKALIYELAHCTEKPPVSFPVIETVEEPEMDLHRQPF
jgi:tetratricopeptide (TPR) repeat protein